jgi:hypothetical protein
MTPESNGSALAAGLIALAGTADDTPEVEALLLRITKLAAERVAAVDYASVTGLGDRGFTMVTTSSDLVAAIDAAQFTQGGPCVQALEDQAPVDVLGLDSMIRWPGFAAEAARLGLDATVSLPLFTGSGAATAVLNLYGRDEVAMAPLAAGIWRVYDPDRPLPFLTGPRPPEPGAQELLTGFAGAVAVRSSIQQAFYRIMDRQQCHASEAYEWLRVYAAETGTTLPAAAHAVLDDQA